MNLTIKALALVCSLTLEGKSVCKPIIFEDVFDSFNKCEHFLIRQRLFEMPEQHKKVIMSHCFVPPRPTPKR